MSLLNRDTLGYNGFLVLFFALSHTILATPSYAESRKFDAWELTCPAQNNATERCRLSQRLAVQESGQTVFAVTVLPGDKKGDLVGIVSIPLGGYIAPGIELRIDGKKAYKLLVETCNANGCHAGFPIPPALSKELQRGKAAIFRLWTTKAKPADVTVSLNQFADAVKALQETVK